MRFLVTSAFVCSLAVLTGCGGGAPDDAPDLAPTSGTVTLDGKPAKNVTVVFEPEKGRPAVATTDDDGKYVIKYKDQEGAVIGKNFVSISTPSEGDGGDGDCGCGCGDGEAAIDPIPPKYNSDSRNNPEMTVEVKAGGDNVFDFNIKSDPAASRAAARSGCGGCGGRDTCE